LVAQDDRKSFRTLGMPDLGEHYSSPPNIPQWGVKGGLSEMFKGRNLILLVTKDDKKSFRTIGIPVLGKHYSSPPNIP
jgi:hypothetical protein